MIGERQNLQNEQELRQQLEQLIEAARAEVVMAIAIAERTQHEEEGAEQIEALKAQLATLEGHSSLIRTGSWTQLQLMQTTLPRAIGAVLQSSHATAQNASFQIGQHAVEMSIEKIEALQMHHNQQSAEFRSYEMQTANRIGRLASSNGVDISGYRMNRARILAEREEAKRKGDRTELFKQDALLAHNNVAGLVLTDAPQLEILEATKHAAEARERFLKEKEIEAVRAGRAAGLSGDKLEEYVTGERDRASADLDAEIKRNAQTAGQKPEQMEKVRGTTTTIFAAEQSAATEIEGRDGSTAELDVSNAQSAEFVSATVKKAAKDAISGLTHKIGKLQFASADPAELKQPDTSPDSSDKSATQSTPAPG